MTDLDTRLRALASGASSGPSPRALRETASGRRRRRQRFAGALILLGAVGVSAAVVASADGDRPAEVRTGPGTSMSDAPTASASTADTRSNSTPEVSDGMRTLGDVEGVTVTVTPSTDLRDGDLVEVRVDGLERLPGAIYALCRGDVTAENAASVCDPRSVQRDGALQPPAVAVGTVALSRTILITEGAADPDRADSYDCATEPAGCALAVAPYEIPVQAVVVPLTFAAGPMPAPMIDVSPADGLSDGQEVTVTAEGLRPNTTFDLALCTGVEDDGLCDVLGWPGAAVSPEGTMRTTVRARSALYGYRGRVDCTVEQCAVVIRDPGGRWAAAAPFRLAAGVVAPVPRLAVEPGGPYVDDQVVTVSGTGFPPGFDVGRSIGQCPNDKDTAVEERCQYPAWGAPVVDAEGRFSVEVTLSDALAFTGSCVTGPGCHLGWVLSHGPTVAKVFLEFGG